MNGMNDAVNRKVSVERLSWRSDKHEPVSIANSAKAFRQKCDECQVEMNYNELDWLNMGLCW